MAIFKELDKDYRLPQSRRHSTKVRMTTALVEEKNQTMSLPSTALSFLNSSVHAGGSWVDRCLVARNTSDKLLGGLDPLANWKRDPSKPGWMITTDPSPTRYTHPGNS